MAAVSLGSAESFINLKQTVAPRDVKICEHLRKSILNLS